MQLKFSRLIMKCNKTKSYKCTRADQYYIARVGTGHWRGSTVISLFLSLNLNQFTGGPFTSCWMKVRTLRHSHCTDLLFFKLYWKKSIFLTKIGRLSIARGHCRYHLSNHSTKKYLTLNKVLPDKVMNM